MSHDAGDAGPAENRRSAAGRRPWIIGAAMVAVLAVVLTIVARWGGDAPPPPAASLSDAAKGRPLMGSAVAGNATSSALDDPEYRAFLAKEFDLLTPENQMKWSVIHPAPGRYSFASTDRIAEFAQANDQRLRGHTLLWYGSLPTWVKDLEGRPCAEMRPVLKDHIRTIASRYRGVVAEWDVVNEAIDGNGRLRVGNNPFLAACGEGIIADAFRWTHEADPEAVLYYNDYEMESDGPKARAVLDLVTRLRGQGVPVHGVGFQAHLTTKDGVPQEFPQVLRRFAENGFQVAVTEADVRMSLVSKQPAPGELDRQAEVFSQLTSACVAEEACRSLTFWGYNDAYSWTGTHWVGLGEGTPMRGDLSPKPAHSAIVEELHSPDVKR